MTNWFWPLAVGTCGRVLRNAPDAGGPGGPTDGGAGSDAGPSAGDAGGDSNSDAGDTGRVPQAQADGDDDSIDDDDAGFDQRYHDELKHRDPKAAKKYRNAINRSKDAAPLLQTLRTLGIDPKDRTAVAAFLRNGVTPKQPAIAPAPQPAAKTEPDKPKWVPLKTDDPFDDAPFRGWDLNEPSNKALYESLKGAHETKMHNRMLANGFVALAERNDKLEERLAALEEGGKKDKTEARVKQWGAIVRDAASKIQDKDTRETFQHAVAGEARYERSQGREPDIQAIVAKHSKRLQKTGQMSAGDAARATAAAQGIADRNRSAPSRAALAPGGSPASPRIDRSSERIGDVARRLGVRSYAGR